MNLPTIRSIILNSSLSTLLNIPCMIILVMKKQENSLQKIQSLQDFQIQFKIGQGATGSIFLASHSNQQFAIKQFSKSKLAKHHKQHLVYVQKEVLKSLNHPGIVKLFTAFQNTKSVFLVLEYLPGGNLEQLINSKKLTEQAKRVYFAELVNIVEYLQSIGLTHRDLKPSNLMISRDGHLKLVDFGTADITNASILPETFKDRIEEMKRKKIFLNEQESQQKKHVLKRKSTFVGTVEFIPPELIEESLFLPASDLWSIGCILYLMYYGSPPFMGATQYEYYQAITKEDPEYPQVVDVPHEAKDLIKKLLVKNPLERLGSGSNQQLSFDAFKNHPYFQNTKTDKVYEIKPPKLKNQQTQLQSKLVQLRLQDHLSYREPGPRNILEKMMVRVSEDSSSIYLCHFKKDMALQEYDMLGEQQESQTHKLMKDPEGKIAHLLSERKFSIGVAEGERLIYISKDVQSICELLNNYYQNPQILQLKKKPFSWIP